MEMTQQFRLASRPEGRVRADHWELREEPVGEPDEGNLLVRVLWLSLDPAMRVWLNADTTYMKPVPVGGVMHAGGIGQVVASRHPGFRAGDYVNGPLGVQTMCLSNGRGLRVVKKTGVPLTHHLGVLGGTGLTAYFGLLKVGAMQAGDTVVISGAAGAVGSVAGQMARLAGCRVIGIAGGAAKCASLVDDLGFHHAIDYKNQDTEKELARLLPDGLDVYFDNVGGDILNAALKNMARGARVVICGAVSRYNSGAAPTGPAAYTFLLERSARMEGYLVSDYSAEFPKAIRHMSEWIADGRLQSRETIVRDFSAFPRHLEELFAGRNYGKMILQVAPDGDPSLH